MSASPNQDLSSISSTQPPKGVSAKRFVRKHIKSLAPYKPIQPFEKLSKQLGRPISQIIKLDANENPYGPSRDVMRSLGSLNFAHIYPDPACVELREQLADMTRTSMDNILVGCGADELIDLLMRVTLDPGDSIIDCPPTFTMYPFDAAVNDANVITIPRNPDFSLDMPAILAAIATHTPKAIFVTSPNNPDGSTIPENDLITLINQDILVVLDEAYIDFSTHPSRMPWVRQNGAGAGNLVVLRTFSKAAGLAGLRVGYGAFPDGLVEYLMRAKQPYNVSVAAQVAASVALRKPAYMEETIAKLVEERQKLFKDLWSIVYLTPYESEANFILCKVHEPWTAKKLQQELRDRFGILIRHYDKDLLRGFVRISVGTPDQTEALVQALTQLGQQ